MVVRPRGGHKGRLRLGLVFGILRGEGEPGYSETWKKKKVQGVQGNPQNLRVPFVLDLFTHPRRPLYSHILTLRRATQVHS